MTLYSKDRKYCFGSLLKNYFVTHGQSGAKLTNYVGTMDFKKKKSKQIPDGNKRAIINNTARKNYPHQLNLPNQ